MAIASSVVHVCLKVLALWPAEGVYWSRNYLRLLSCFQTPEPARGHRRKLTMLSSEEWLLWWCLPSSVHSLFSVDTLPDTKVKHRASAIILDHEHILEFKCFFVTSGVGRNWSGQRGRRGGLWLIYVFFFFVLFFLQELTSHMKPKGRTTRPTQTRPSSTRRVDTTTQTRRRSIISKLDRPGETGGDAGGVGGGGGAVGALCLTPIGYERAWGACEGEIL